jgi:hypothetical protein
MVGGGEGRKSYQNGLSSSLYAIQSQEEGWSILFALVLLAVYFQPLKDKWDAVLSLVVLDLGHGGTVCLSSGPQPFPSLPLG